MSLLDKAEMNAAKAWAGLFKTVTGLLKRIDRIFTIPKAPKAIKYWRDVQVAFWGFCSLIVGYLILLRFVK